MKKIMGIALLGCSLLSGSAIAGPIELHGDVRLEYLHIKDRLNGDVNDYPNLSDPYSSSGSQLQGRFALEKPLNDKWTLFTRASALSGQGSVDAGFDQYGARWKNGTWDVSIGKQSVSLGQGTILGTGDAAMSNDNKFTGVVIATKSGKADIKLIAGDTDDTWAVGGVRSRWYGGDISYPLSEKWKVGAAAAYSKAAEEGSDGTYYGALNGSWQISKRLTWNAEYAWPNAGKANAWFTNLAYKMERDTFSVQYNKVDYAAVDQGNSAIGAVIFPFSGTNLLSGNSRYSGFSYQYSHNFNDAWSVDVTYMNLKADGLSGSDQELKIGLQMAF